MEYLIGIVLALVVCVFALVVGFDRERVFYPTMVGANVTATTDCLKAKQKLRDAEYIGPSSRKALLRMTGTKTDSHHCK